MAKFGIKGCVSCKYSICKDEFSNFCTYSETETPIILYLFQNDDEIKDKKENAFYLAPNICDNWEKMDKISDL